MEMAAAADYSRTRRERVRHAGDYDGRGCKRRRMESQAGLARFVSTGQVLPSVNAAAAAAHPEEYLPTTLGRRIAEGARARREERERSRRGQETPPPPPEPGSLASNAVVARMMAMHGYKPGTGLGKNSQGIVAPLEATRLPNKAGIGSFQVVKLFSAKDKENLPPSSAEAEPRWSRKASANKSKELPPAVRGTEQAFKVIDMRGPQARVLTDFAGLLNQQQEMEVDHDDAPMPELQYNVRLLADESQAGIALLDARLRREQDNAAALMWEKEETAKQEALQKRQLHVLETIDGVLEQVRADFATGLLTLEASLETFRALQASYGQEFKTCSIARIACGFVHPLLMSFFQGWEPLKNPSFGLEVMLSLKDLLQEGDQPYDDLSDNPYVQLVNEAILPALRTSATNKWDATDPEQPMLCFLELWERLLPPFMLQSALDHVVMPKLSDAVDSWNPREGRLPIHVWVHPWLPALGQYRIDTLCHSIRHKLSLLLETEWQAHDDYYAVLSPWKGVFDPATWEGLVVSNIIPKLRMVLQKKLGMNPDNHNLHCFNLVMMWSSVIPAHYMVCMLEADFFGRWHQALYGLACSPDPDFTGIMNWYKVCKGLFPPELLANERIRMLLTTGLNMMNQAAQRLEVAQPAARENPGYVARQASDYSSHHAAPGATASMVDLNFKESIQAYAMEHGLLFMPRVGRFYNGFQVYQFGTASIYIDSVKGIPFAQLEEGWSSVSLTELLKMNQLAKPC